MARVTIGEVKAVIQTDRSNLDPFINSASRLVDDELVGHGMSDDVLKDIELWLSAHFIASVDGVKSQESIGDASVSLDRGQPVDGPIGGTPYGRTALSLDRTGRLARSGGRGVVVEAL